MTTLTELLFGSFIGPLAFVALVLGIGLALWAGRGAPSRADLLEENRRLRAEQKEE